MTQDKITIKGPAKINLYLHIVGKKNDGYHLIESLFMTLPNLCDVLEIEEQDGFELVVSGKYEKNSGNLTNNIVAKAATMLMDKFPDKNLGAKITLQKNIPVGAGLGGGSSDAAAALRALNKFWHLNLNLDELAEIGLSLGADVPFFVKGKNAFVSGIGEKITLCEIDNMYILLVNPNKHVSTLGVYKGFAGNFSESIIGERFAEYPLIKNAHNDLQKSAINIEPEIRSVLEKLQTQKGCDFARMSGSGSTCFAVFDSSANLDAARTNIAQSHPSWLCI